MPGLPSGIYTIDPDGMDTGADAFEVYCDMDTDGGGWTLVGDYISNKELFNFNPAQHQLQNDAGGGGLAIGCNGGGITYGKDGSWQGRVWLR